MAISPTAEGFRAAFRRPSLTFAEIMWRWTVGATATAIFLFGLTEYLSTLPVTNGELLFLRSRQPYLISEAIAHILRGTLNRVVIAALVAALLLTWFWMVVAALGRIATVRGLLDYFRSDAAPYVSTNGVPTSTGSTNGSERQIESAVSTTHGYEGSNSPFRPLVRLNFLRAALALAAILGFVGAAILAGFASTDTNPRPGLVFFLFLPPAALICLVWSSLNWLLSLAALFAVRDQKDTLAAISSAVSLCGDRTGAVCAVSTWTGLAHLAIFVGASSVVMMPMGFIAIVPWRVVVAVMILLTLAYLALADWLYMARLAGYVCIAERPEALLAPMPPVPPPAPQSAPPLRTSVDRDEPILSDLPGLA